MPSQRKSWRDIYEDLKYDIESGHHPQGASCPSEQELCAEYGVSRGTIRRALSHLFRDGYLELCPGQRRVVRRPEPLPYAKIFLTHPTDEHKVVIPSFGQHLTNMALRDQWKEEDYPKDEVISRPTTLAWYSIANEPRLPTKDIKRVFNFRGEEEIIWFIRARYAKKNPLVLQWTVVPAELVPQITKDDLQPGGMTSRYQQRGLQRHSYHASYGPATASSEEARHLRVEPGTPLVAEQRVSFFKDEARGGDLRPYEMLVTLYTARIQLEFHWEDTKPKDQGGGNGRSRKRKARATRGGARP